MLKRFPATTHNYAKLGAETGVGELTDLKAKVQFPQVAHISDYLLLCDSSEHSESLKIGLKAALLMLLKLPKWTGQRLVEQEVPSSIPCLSK